MAFDPDRLLGWRFDPVVHGYGERDAILYALGVGLPADPLDRDELAYLLEDRLKVLPTFAVTLASPGMWVKAPELAIDWVRLLHTAHAARFHRPLPRTATVTGTARIRSLHDRGAEKGAVCVVERRIADAGTGDLYCTVEQTLLLRGNGGFGGEPPPRAERARPSERAPDMTATIAISPRAALVYRLSGDLNPLHADPEVARTAGFERPILHGLAAYGIAGAQIVRRFCGDDPARLKSLSMRFAGIALPGSAVEFSAWIQGPHIFFEARSEGRTILDQGIAEIAET